MSLLHGKAINKALGKGISHLLKGQIYQFLHQIPSDNDFSTACPLLGASIGQHLRHVNDHFRCLISNVPNTTDPHSLPRYDIYRNRESTIETSLGQAKSSILDLDADLQQLLFENKLESHQMSQKINVSFLTGGEENKLESHQMSQKINVSFLTGGEETIFQSTIGRELSFCMHHAYHHCASMKLIAQNNGFLEAVPDGFGIAPSTAIFLETKGDTKD